MCCLMVRGDVSFLYLVCWLMKTSCFGVEWKSTSLCAVSLCMFQRNSGLMKWLIFWLSIIGVLWECVLWLMSCDTSSVVYTKQFFSVISGTLFSVVSNESRSLCLWLLRFASFRGL